jgi:hypothetical protein
MKCKYKKELQSIYEMSLSDDIEAKDLAISLFWTSEYVKDNKIKPELRLYVTENKRKGLMETIDYYTGEINTSKYENFSRILDDLIRGNAYFVKEELK